MDYGFTMWNRARFLFQFVTYRMIVLPFEVQNPRLKIFLHEMVRPIVKAAGLLDRNQNILKPLWVSHVETKSGIFNIRPQFNDMTIVSPAFERPDMNYLVKQIRKDVKRSSKVLFIDIGADFGIYTTTVGNHFKHEKDFRIMAIEPIASSFELLERNINANGLSEIAEAHECTLSSQGGKDVYICYCEGMGHIVDEPHCQGYLQEVRTTTLDSLSASSKDDNDVIYIKIDVEGHEIDVLEGAKSLLTSGRPCHLLIEDSGDSRVIDYLESARAKFIRKLTPYNSWWLFS